MDKELKIKIVASGNEDVTRDIKRLNESIISDTKKANDTIDQANRALVRSLIAQDEQYTQDKELQHRTLIRSLVAQDELYLQEQKKIQSDLIAANTQAEYDKSQQHRALIRSLTSQDEAYKQEQKRIQEEIKAVNIQTNLDRQQQYRAMIRSLSAQDEIYKANEKSLNEWIIAEDKKTAQAKVQAQKEADAQILRDNELQARTQRRLMEQALINSNNNYTASQQPKSVGPVQNLPLNPNSIAGLQQQEKYYKSLLSTLAGGTPTFNQTKSHLEGISGKLKELQAPTQKADFNFKSLIGTIRDISIAGFAAERVFGFIWDKFTVAAENEMPAERFNELAGGIDKAEQRLELLQKASAKNMSDAALKDYSNKVENLGGKFDTVVLSIDAVERMSDRFKVNWDKAFTGFEKFINSGTTKTFSEMGLSVGKLNANVKELTEATGKYEEQLTDVEKQQIRTDAFVKTFGSTIEEVGNKKMDIGDKVASIHATWENFSDFIGGSFIPYFDDLFNKGENISIVFESIFGKGNNLKKVFGEIILYSNPITGISHAFDSIDHSIDSLIGTTVQWKSMLETVLTLMGQIHPTTGNTGTGATGTWEANNVDDFSFGGNKLKTPKLPVYRNQKAVQDELAIAELSKRTAKNKEDEAKWDEKIKALKKEDAAFNKNESIHTDKQKKDREDELYTLDKFLKYLHAEIELNDELYKQHRKTKEAYDAENKKLLDLLDANESLTKVVKEHISAEEEKTTILENQAKFLKQQLDIIEKINKAEQSKYGVVGRPNPATEGGSEYTGGTPHAGNADFPITQSRSNKEQSDPSQPGTLNDFNNFGSQVGSIFGNLITTFHVDANSALADIAAGWNTIVGITQTIEQIFETIKMAQQVGSFLGSLLSFIPGGSGIASAVGASAATGRGANLFNPNPGVNRVLNNLQSFSTGRQNIHVHIGGRVEVHAKGSNLYGAINEFKTELDEGRY